MPVLLRGISSHGQPYSIPACHCMRSNTVNKLYSDLEKKSQVESLP